MKLGYRGRKSQAALEFLTTYGWAFLVILIMIGALAYFGILRPSRLLPDRCNFGPELECQDFQIVHGGGTLGTIKIRLKNNVGEAIIVTAMTESAESATALVCTDPTNIGVSDVWTPGQIREFTWIDCNTDGVGFVAQEKGKVLISVNYYAVRSGSGFGHDVAGEIFSTVLT